LPRSQLHYRKAIRVSAVELINVLEGYIWNGGKLEKYRDACQRFIAAYRRL
jgi:hypothetical protein